MGGRSSGSATPNEPIPQTDKLGFPSSDKREFHDLTDADAQAIYEKQKLTPDQLKAIEYYIDPWKEPGSQYSFSQNLNHAMINDGYLGSKKAFTRDQLLSAMHNLGENVNLTRYDHEEFVNVLLAGKGINMWDYKDLTEDELRSALIGTKYGENRFISTSYNDMKQASKKSQMTFRHRAVRIEYRARASTQVLFPGDGPGGKLGEVIIKPGNGATNMRIVDVKYDHKRKVRQKGTDWLSDQSQLVLTVEVG